MTTTAATLTFPLTVPSDLFYFWVMHFATWGVVQRQDSRLWIWLSRFES